MKLIGAKPVHEPLHVLLIGNNPIEMSSVLEKLRQVRHRKVITEIAFDIKSTVERLINFHPNFIILDDNLGKAELKETVKALSSGKKTRDVPITVLKNSNYRESLASNGVMDFILKQNLSADALYSTIRNAFRLKRTHKLLAKTYLGKKGLLKRLTEKTTLNFIG